MMTKKAKTRAAQTQVRLLPAVAGVAAILLALKAGGLAFEASAATAPPQGKQTPAEQPPQPAQTAPAAKSATDPVAAINAALPMPPNKPPLSASETAKAPAKSAEALEADLSGSGVSQGEMDVLTSLASRRDALEERQRQLDMRANVIAAAEKRVDEKIAQLKALQTQLETMMGQRDKKEAEQLDSLVRVYSAMKPRDAARIFGSLDGRVRIGVAAKMKPDAMAGILAALSAEEAQKLTVELANQYKVPAQMAAAASAAPAAVAAPAASAASKPTP